MSFYYSNLLNYVKILCEFCVNSSDLKLIRISVSMNPSVIMPITRKRKSTAITTTPAATPAPAAAAKKPSSKPKKRRPVVVSPKVKPASKAAKSRGRPATSKKAAKPEQPVLVDDESCEEEISSSEIANDTLVESDVEATPEVESVPVVGSKNRKALELELRRLKLEEELEKL